MTIIQTSHYCLVCYFLKIKDACVILCKSVGFEFVKMGKELKINICQVLPAVNNFGIVLNKPILYLCVL